MTFSRAMQRALMDDAQKLRDEGVDCDDPIFISDEEIAIAAHTDNVIDLMQALKDSLKPSHNETSNDEKD